ncbi:MAG: RNA polymerase sigma factor [Ilyomonas sp.]
MNKERLENISDQELLERFYKEKDNQYLGPLLQRYTLLLLGVCMKYLKNEQEAKDCVQQIFLKVITELQKYKVEYFKSWLYMIARNHCLMKLRDKPTKSLKELSESFLLTEDIDIKTDSFERDMVLNFVEEGVNELNEEQKKCILLFYFKKKSYQEISELTGFSAMQVKSYIQNGKRNLKLLVEKKLQENNG